MSLQARQRKLLAKKKEEQKRVWAQNDKDPNGANDIKTNFISKADINRGNSRPKNSGKPEEIVSCPYCGHHATVSKMRIHNTLHPNRIIRGVYLGGYENARDKVTLKDKLKITHVLNCALELKNYFPKTFKYRHLELQDREKQNISDTFNSAFKFIDEALKTRNGKCFVHCQEGKSRSVSIVAAYLMSRHKYTLDNALATITSKRGIAQPNKGFLAELRAFEKKLSVETMDENKVDI